ncbi:alpha/beta-hydrolase [Dothidotthia symphoricarpi CBS 119687]|uniref:Alpha/beta-hydrolase n=1 Tax=Dothidotthia symphoricarpi CBS 119687 TaxID=1392245 RepID=A0A6A6A6G3_9PLEO|nr:alpha/beta-hydrolase [Dothidotthia symphoricarpi CBS 119687]KAF2127400.1 alpha/beta-hydrolase [Dothidotthia symphoricarpi CBS 119687]
MSTTTHFNVIEHRAPCSHIREYARATSCLDEDELYLAVKQYVPRVKVSGDRQRGTGITLIACHANAFPKELYEPFWDALYEYMQKAEKTHILSIWIADVANQGQSGIWNEGKLGNEPSWFDHARDILAMVNHFRKDMIQPIVGFGHSMGGVVLLNAALIHPRLFTTLVTFEATVFKNPRQHTSLGANPITFRKDQWPSREAAAKSLVRYPMFKAFNSTVMDLFLKYGLRDLPTVLYPASIPPGSPIPVTLTTTKHQEVLNYTRAAFPPNRSTPLSEFVPTHIAHPDIGDADWRHPREPFYRPEIPLTFLQLPRLRPSCFWLYGADTTLMPEKFKRDDRTNTTGIGIGGSGGVAQGRVREQVIPGGGHFLPFEQPQSLAENVVGPWFSSEVERWEADMKIERKAWEEVDVAQRSQVSDDWMHWMKTHNDPRKETRAMRLKL